MCGIVAAVARRNVVPILIEGLRRLEYRGYDSAGVAVINGGLERIRSTGRVAELARLAVGLQGTIGIGHTRWATHGVPSERNAHPHVSGGISVVHNGIIENHGAIRTRLQAAGYVFTSDTDTEVIAHLIHSYRGLDLFQAVQAAVRELKGAYAIAVIGADDAARLVVARMGAPLLLGIGEHENFAASDTSALLQVTQKVIYLEEGDCAEVSLDDVRIVEKSRGSRLNRPVHRRIVRTATIGCPKGRRPLPTSRLSLVAVSTFVDVAAPPGAVRSGHVLVAQMVGPDRSHGDAGTGRPGPSRHRGAQDSARLVRRRRCVRHRRRSRRLHPERFGGRHRQWDDLGAGGH